ncbi:MAG: iron-sulfur cluster assembly accessory protein [Acidobacteria bacterium]|nr:iron-sulfur cluster assembly accessory protein [Acidobacteriota bacterium]MBI3658777.1 iron-sulfur cluster assembly accessory protein [Acidobacteriota bacterium]
MEVNTETKLTVSLTPAAIEKVREIMAQQPEPYEGLRVRVIGGGCSGFQYQLHFEKDANTGDPSFDFSGVKVFIDERSLLYINGTEIDFVDGLQGSGFKFNNPNVKGSCGCGESFTV